MSFDKYYPDIFYDIQRLSLPKRIQILKEAKDISYHWWTDILDCSKSIRREKIEMTFDEALSKIDKSTIFVFIHRRGYKSWKSLFEKGFSQSGWRLEVGYTTMNSPDYFLWIEVKEDKIEDLVNKYKLKLM